MYRRLNNYFIDNNKNNLRGCSLLIFQNGLKNLLLGSLQAVLRPLPYGFLISTLIVTEGFFLLMFLISIKMSIYKSQIKIWVYIILNAVKMLLLLTLYWDYQDINLPAVETMQQNLLFLIMIFFCLGILIELVFQVTECKHCITKFFCKLMRS